LSVSQAQQKSKIKFLMALYGVRSYEHTLSCYRAKLRCARILR
jgi:hypothetical protein